MGNDVKELPILRINEKGRHRIQDPVVIEFSLTIVVNNQELISLLCSPTKLEYLTLGYLLSAGLIEERDDIKKIIVDQQTGMAMVETKMELNIPARWALGSSGGRTVSPLKTGAVNAGGQFRMSASAVLSLVEDFLVRSSSFRNTGALHSAALCHHEGIIIFSEDIGRHNAIDKVLGECLWEGILTKNHAIITSGRISSEILLKAARRSVPILISKAAPTDQGVQLANDLGVTLVGFVREGRMNIYANDWRIFT